ncbi:hypothetical protein HZH68_011265 [Vespula germanica]|uniref:Uncharacterized protein n=1 Tax=Vespula germanica TaxID=30212 RepID=A0A834JQY1_VESGE|nr:hypothetical protein HZH68_011265 [Vespula germanica]
MEKRVCFVRDKKKSEKNGKWEKIRESIGGPAAVDATTRSHRAAGGATKKRRHLRLTNKSMMMSSGVLLMIFYDDDDDDNDDDNDDDDDDDDDDGSGNNDDRKDRGTTVPYGQECKRKLDYLLIEYIIRKQNQLY